MSTIVVTGGSRGLGAEIVRAMGVSLPEPHHIINVDCVKTERVETRDVYDEFILDLTKSGEVDEFKRWMGEMSVDVLINNAGINLIDYLEDLEEEDWDLVMDTNAKAIYMMTKALLPNLIAAEGTVLNIISNASHMPMTSSLAYNASKGAAHIMTLQMARELKDLTVFGISPNRLEGTDMSAHIDKRVCEVRGWTPEYAREYQKQALIAGKETDPAELARLIAFLLQDKAHHEFLNGTIIPYGK